VSAPAKKALEFASSSLRADEGLVLRAVGQSRDALRFAAQALRQDRVFALRVIAANPAALEAMG
jgi:hypothetical protein